MLRLGRCGNAEIRCAAPAAMATPAPSSIAPVPGSQESRCPPMAITSSACSLPVDLADDVGAGVLTLGAAVQIELQRHRFACGEHAFEQVGIRVGKRGGGNLRRLRVKMSDTGMRETVVVGSRRAQHEGLRSKLGRQRGTRGATGRGRAVVVTVALRVHAVADVYYFSFYTFRRGRLQCGKILERDHLSAKPTLRRGRTSTEREHGQRLRERRNDRRAFAAAYPFRIGHRLAPHLVETQSLETCRDPVARALVIRTTGQARADLRRQVGDEVVRDRIGCRLVAKFRRGAQRFRCNARQFAAARR